MTIFTGDDISGKRLKIFRACKSNLKIVTAYQKGSFLSTFRNSWKIHGRFGAHVRLQIGWRLQFWVKPKTPGEEVVTCARKPGPCSYHHKLARWLVAEGWDYAEQRECICSWWNGIMVEQAVPNGNDESLGKLPQLGVQ